MERRTVVELLLLRDQVERRRSCIRGALFVIHLEKWCTALNVWAKTRIIVVAFRRHPREDREAERERECE